MNLRLRRRKRFYNYVGRLRRTRERIYFLSFGDGGRVLRLQVKHRDEANQTEGGPLFLLLSTTFFGKRTRKVKTITVATSNGLTFVWLHFCTIHT